MKDCPFFCGIHLTKERSLALMRDSYETHKGGVA